MQCKCGGRGGTAAVLFALPPLSLSCTCVSPVTADACGTSWQRCRAFKKLTAWQTIYGCMSACVCVYVYVDNFTPQLENVCQLYLKKKGTPHTLILVFSWLLSLSVSLFSNEGVESKRTGKWANQKRQRYLNCFFFLAIYLCYTSAATPTSTATLKGASHSLPEWLPVWVCVCVWVCAICNYSTLTLTEKLPVCECTCMCAWCMCGWTSL